MLLVITWVAVFRLEAAPRTYVEVLNSTFSPILVEGVSIPRGASHQFPVEPGVPGTLSGAVTYPGLREGEFYLIDVRKLSIPSEETGISHEMRQTVTDAKEALRAATELAGATAVESAASGAGDRDEALRAVEEAGKAAAEGESREKTLQTPVEIPSADLVTVPLNLSTIYKLERPHYIFLHAKNGKWNESRSDKFREVMKNEDFLRNLTEHLNSIDKTQHEDDNSAATPILEMLRKNAPSSSPWKPSQVARALMAVNIAAPYDSRKVDDIMKTIDLDDFDKESETK